MGRRPTWEMYEIWNTFGINTLKTWVVEMHRKCTVPTPPRTTDKTSNLVERGWTLKSALLASACGPSNLANPIWYADIQTHTHSFRKAVLCSVVLPPFNCFSIHSVINQNEDGWRKSAFLTRACFPCTIHVTFRHRASCILGQAFN